MWGRCRNPSRASVLFVCPDRCQTFSFSTTEKQIPARAIKPAAYELFLDRVLKLSTHPKLFGKSRFGIMLHESEKIVRNRYRSHWFPPLMPGIAGRQGRNLF